MFSVFENTCSVTPAERRSSRRYIVESLITSGLFVGLVLVSVSHVSGLHGSLKYFVALLPVIGVVASAAAIWRFMLRMDELQRRTFVDSAAIAAVVTAIVTTAFGLLENTGFPRISMTWVWPIAMLSWAIALPFVSRRYN